MPRITLDTEDLGVAQEKPVPIGEISDGEGKSIEVDDTFSEDSVALEAFMHELVTVRVHGSAAEGDYPVVPLNVNGMNQPLMREVDMPIKRKYVEAMARAKTTSYRQVVSPTDPSDISMVPTTVLSYNFSIIEDSPAGKAWLKKILQQPV